MNEQVKKFLALAPLMMPDFLNSIPEPEIITGAAVLEFEFNYETQYGIVMDQIEDDMELCLLYHSTEKMGNKHYCCFYAAPSNSSIFYKINLISNKKGYCDGLTVTIYDDILVMQQSLQEELERLTTDDYNVIMSIEDNEFMKSFFV